MSACGVERRRRRLRRSNPVCGMIVDVARVRLRSEHEGRTYFFCSAGCRRKFDADPVKYAVG
jgi:YHS domain-containing protein